MDPISKQKLKYMQNMREIINRTPNKWSNLTTKEFERDIALLQTYAKNGIELEKEIAALHRDYGREIAALKNK